MGGESSKIMEKHQHSDMESYLESYQAECKQDPFLQKLDSDLQQSTRQVIESLNGDVKAGGDRSLSLNSVKQITDCFVKKNVNVANYILKFKEDVLRDADLYEIVNDYFNNSFLILKVCTDLKGCINRARNSDLFIKVALHYFETGQRKSGLDSLEKFKAAGNPFTKEFSSLLKQVYEKQESMLQNLKEKKIELDEKLNKASTWWTVSNVLFGVTAFALLICFAVTAFFVAPALLGTMLAVVPSTTAVGVGVGVAVVGVGGINYLWKKYEDELEAQRERIITSLESCCIGKDQLRVIESGVDKLKMVMESVLGNADLALDEYRDDDYALQQTMDTINRELRGFRESIEELDKHADECERQVIKAQQEMFHNIKKYSTVL